ncbi:hypothetical protein CCACVL1_03619 [Corchorus capsularis]|uniref:Uncharacterized protein n=1 Tax=Corchorus capsularis TaxID=210143 RepID=A0A1R3JYA6_COCAP|nr:hypothetical protein CCACVL1_03619 [Corchorus capsularis]
MFGLDERSVLAANELTEDMIFPTEPTIIAPPQAPTPPPPSQITIAPVRNYKYSHKHSSLKAALEAPATPEPKPLWDSIAYSHKSWFVSTQWGRYPVESLTTYKFKDLEAAIRNFSESNIIKGSVT